MQLKYMRRALELAQKAAQEDEVPIGAVLVDAQKDEILARAARVALLVLREIRRPFCRHTFAWSPIFRWIQRSSLRWVFGRGGSLLRLPLDFIAALESGIGHRCGICPVVVR